VTERLRQLAQQVDAFSPRERALLLLAVLGLLFFLWDHFFALPLEARAKRLGDRMEQTRGQVSGLSEKLQPLLVATEQDPDAHDRRVLERLEGQLAELDRRLRAGVREVIAPDQMPAVLRQVLDQVVHGDRRLTLLRLEGRSAQPKPAPDGDKTGHARAAPALHHHPLTLELTGGYLAALDYLRALESLDWRLFWDGLTLEVEEHPQIRLRIHLHTLSIDEGWIGV
jgi:MSHA biogenesis protein MshJ